MKKFSCPVSHYTHTIFLILLYLFWIDRIKFTETQNNTLMLLEKNLDYNFIYIISKRIFCLGQKRIVKQKYFIPAKKYIHNSNNY